ncbi:hypothetical protein GCM10020227_47800 [Streptomyces flavovirens]
MPRGRAQRILPFSTRTHATVSIRTDISPPSFTHPRQPGPYRQRGSALTGPVGPGARGGGGRGSSYGKAPATAPENGSGVRKRTRVTVGAVERPRGRTGQGCALWPTRSTQ